MKKFLFILGICAATLTSSFAQAGSSYFVTNNLTASARSLITGTFLLESITLTTTNTVPTVVRLYDGDTTYITQAYTNYVSYTTNIISTYISVLGTTNTMTNTVLWNGLTGHALATNNTPVIAAVVANPGTLPVVTWTPTTAIPFVNKLTLSNDAAGLNVIVRYRLP